MSEGLRIGWTKRIGWLGVAGLVLGLGFGLAFARGDDESVIGLFPVELVDPAPEDPFEIDALLAPAPLDCESDCRERTLRLVGGDIVTVRSATTPSLRLIGDRVDFVELSGAAGGEPAVDEGTNGERFAVYVVLDREGREAWSEFARVNARRFVLVEIDDQPVDLFRPLGWSRGLRIGVFDDERRREAFVTGLPFNTRKARER